MSISPEQSKIAFQKSMRALVKLSSGLDAKNVHSFRTSTLRLQTLLEQLVPNRDRNQKKLLKMLGRIRKRAGKVRDLDVQLTALRSLKVPQEPRRKTQLTQGLLELRAEHEKKLRKLLTKETIKEIHKRLRRASKEIKLAPGRDALRDPLKVARTMLSRITRPAGPITEDLLHEYRTVVKRARYAAEFAPKSSEAAQLISQLRRLQDALGNWHDWLNLTQTAAKRIGEVNQSSLVAALNHVTAGKFRQAVAALSAAPMLQAGPKPLPGNSESPRKKTTNMPAQLKGTETAA
ncbi:MAG: CHAD domain-containing protein [Candidatus Sulfotelmatobacter sp.]|jgi:CHAD domain-containing protein